MLLTTSAVPVRSSVSSGNRQGRRRQITKCALVSKPSKFLEKACGRLAMVGFVAGTAAMAVSGEDLSTQLVESLPAVAGTTALIGYASYKTDDIEYWPQKKPFTSDIELLNGRMAMAGLALRFLYEQC